MDIHSIISSGILERYLAGMSSPEEEKEIQELMDKHPIVVEELAHIRQALGAYAKIHQVQPPPDLKQKVLQVLSEPAKSLTKSKNTPPTRETVADVRRPEKKPLNWTQSLPLLLALALVGAVLAVFLFMSQAGNAKKELAGAKAQLDSLQTAHAAQLESFKQEQQAYEALRHPDNVPVALAATEAGSSAMAVVHWNGETRTAQVDVRNLPVPPSGMAYQLWASASGKGQFLATLPSSEANRGLQSIPFVENPQSFYVTLELQARTTEPTLKNVVLFGRVGK